MIARFNRFRNDSRAVMPLAVIAVLVTAYAIKQVIRPVGTTTVQVREITQATPATVEIPNPLSQSTEETRSSSTVDGRRNPYYHPSLLTNEESLPAAESPSGADQKTALKILPPLGTTFSSQYSNNPASNDNAPGVGKNIEPDSVPPTSRDSDAVNVKNTAIDGEHASLQRPPYRLSVVMLAANPAAILSSPEGENLYVALHDALPDGWRVARITESYVALERYDLAYLLFLTPGGLR